MLTLEDYFRGHLNPPAEVVTSATELLNRVNACLAEVPYSEAQNPKISSGWRPADYNATVPNAAPNSKHITGQAVDISDPDGVIDAYLHTYFQILAKHELWAEHPASTKGWSHLQSIAPRSGNRFFYP